ncbi:hypothetical protein [Longispora urticae]
MTSPEANDSDVTNDDPDGAWTLTLGDDGTPGNIGRYEFLRFDPKSDIPFLSDSARIGEVLGKFGGEEQTDLAELFTLIGGLGNSVFEVAIDPLNALLSAGLGFLIDVVQPVEDLLGLVTGNAERMGTEIARWERVGKALVPLAAEVRASGNESLLGWQGKTGEEARQRLGAFADGMRAVATDIKLIEVCLLLAKAVMEIAQAFLIGLLATWVEWLIITWVMALATAPETAGASVNLAAVATEIEGTVVLSRGVVFLDRVVPVLNRLQRFFNKYEPDKMPGIRDGFRPPAGQRTPGDVAREYSASEDTWMPAGVKAAGGVASVGVRYQDWLDDPHRRDQADIERYLDKDR